jgi:hypothetical protein
MMNNTPNELLADDGQDEAYMLALCAEEAIASDPTPSPHYLVFEKWGGAQLIVQETGQRIYHGDRDQLEQIQRRAERLLARCSQFTPAQAARIESGCLHLPPVD